MEKEWQIRPYYKQELALAYSPYVTPRTAVNRLSLWIKYNTELHEALIATGYHPYQKLLTSRQVELIFQYLGQP
jgi:hypothetical protein